MSTTVVVLLVVFQLKHFLADFPLQGRWMLGKFKPGWDFVPPLAAHCSVHAALTASVFLAAGAGRLAFALAALDFVAHFAMDRIKASPRMLGRWKPDSPFFWWSLGADQAWHHLTHYLLIGLFLVARS